MLLNFALLINVNTCITSLAASRRERHLDTYHETQTNLGLCCYSNHTFIGKEEKPAILHSFFSISDQLQCNLEH